MTMETSTPMGSPLRRKLSTKQNYLQIEDNEEDIEDELLKRRLEAINKSSEMRRRSAVPALPSAKFAEYCQECIKLSTENKINSKNAFHFVLIDFMAAMAKKSDSEISKNFQVASYTLDASVKIYGYRVDAVHIDAMKMAGGVLSKEVDNDEGDNDVDIDGKPVAKTKAKKKKRKSNLVTPASICLKAESECLLDEIPGTNTISRFGDCTSLLTKIPKYDDNCLLLVKDDDLCWLAESNVAPEIPEFEPQPLLDAFLDASLTNECKLCEALGEIDFNAELESDESASDNEPTQISTFEFDINASVQDAHMEVEENNPIAPKLTVPCSGYDSGEEIVLPCQPQRNLNRLGCLTEMKNKLSINEMEYSMFDEKIFKAWAGPAYWKVHPHKLSEENKENNVWRVAATKRTRRGKVVEPVGPFEVSEQVLSKQLELVEKTILAKSTLCNWKASSVTQGKDYKYDSKSLFTLFHLPILVAKPKEEVQGVEEVIQIKNELVDDCETHAEELDYCSQSIFDEEPPTPMDGQPIEGVKEEGADVNEWDAENMLAVPNKVMKMSMGTFNKKAYVDIKHLKKGIWNTLAPGALDAVETPMQFSQLLKICPQKLPCNVVGKVNASLVFNALLHLANEKCLKLCQAIKGADLVVSQ